MTNPLNDGTPNNLSASTLLSTESVTQEITFLDILVILAQRKRLIAITTILLTALGIIAAFVLPKKFTATAIILPPQGNTSMGSALTMQMASASSVAGLASSALGLKNLNEMYVAMLKSRTVEEAVIQHYGLMTEYDEKYLVDARKDLERHTKIDGSTKDGLIRLSFDNRNPARASEIANGYVEQFKTLSQHLAISEASQRRAVFEKQLEQTKNDLANADEALKQTQITTGMIQLDSQARAMIDSAARLRAQMVAKQVQIEAMRTYAARENPALTEAEGELEGLRSQFDKLVGSRDAAGDDLFLPKGAVPQAGLEYIRKLRDVKYYEAIFEILARQLEVAKLDEAKEGAFIQVVDPAVPPEQKSFPKPGLIIAGAAVFGFTFGLVMALFLGALERMNANPVKREKIAQLKRALWMNPVSSRASQAI